MTRRPPLPDFTSKAFFCPKQPHIIRRFHDENRRSQPDPYLSMASASNPSTDPETVTTSAEVGLLVSIRDNWESFLDISREF